MMPELATMCRQIVTVAPRTGVDGYNQPTYGTAVAYRARVTGKRTMQFNDRGEEVLATKVVYFAASNAAIAAHDLLTLSTGDVDSTESGVTQPTVIAVSRIPDERGRLSIIAYTA